MEEAAAVVVGGGHVGRVGGDRVVRGRLGAHGSGQAAAQRAGALHLHAVGQGHLVLEGLLVILPAAAGRSGGRRGGAAARVGVRRDFLGRRRREAEEMRAGVGGRRERGGRGGARRGAAASGVDRDGAGRRAGRRRVQRPLSERVHRPRVVMVSRRESRFAAIQPRQAGAVEQVRPAHLAAGQTGWERRKRRQSAKQAKSLG